MLLILDEWIIHDLQNDNGEERQKESFEFLQKIMKKCDKIVVVENSKFNKKIWNFLKTAHQKPIELNKKAKLLSADFLFNSQKTEFIKLESIEPEEMPEEMKEVLKEVNPDDHYIVITYHVLKEYGKECLIITTDKQLLKILIKYNIECKYRDNFLQQYIEEK